MELDARSGSVESGKFLWKRKLEVVKGYPFHLAIYIKRRKLKCGAMLWFGKPTFAKKAFGSLIKPAPHLSQFKNEPCSLPTQFYI